MGVIQTKVEQNNTKRLAYKEKEASVNVVQMHKRNFNEVSNAIKYFTYLFLPFPRTNATLVCK